MPIAEKHLADIGRKYDLGPKQFDEKAKAKLLAYPWPGNIRELLAVVERAAILSEGEAITPTDLFLDARS